MKLVSQKKGMILSIFKKLVCKITIPVCREVKQSKDLEYPLERKIIVENKFEIVKHIGKLSDINNGYTKELSFMAWNHREPVYDIRTWNQEHTKYGKGVTLTLREMALLQDLMKEGE